MGSHDAGLWSIDFQNMCEVAECNGVQILNVVQFIVKSSTYLLNTVGCYGYWWNIFCFLFFPFLFWVSLNLVLLWLLLNRLCFLLFSFLFWVYLNLVLLWVLLNRFCFLLFSFSSFCFEYLWIRCILTWNVMLNVILLMFDVFWVELWCWM